MVKIYRFVKIAIINILSFLVLLFIANWIAGAFSTPSRQRYELPNYNNDREHAKEVFKDYVKIQHQYEAFVEWRALPYNGKTTHIDENGFRIQPPSPSPNLQGKSVYFLGGSTMWGEGSDDEHTIPALFQQLKPQYKVYNHGQLAYNTRQELDALITLYAKKTNPDIVISYDGVNDAAFLCPSEITDLPGHRLVPLFRKRLYPSKTSMIKEALYKFFLENIINKISSGQANQVKRYDCVSNPEKLEEIADMFIRNWELAHEIVTNRHGKFIAILQPAAFISHPRIDHLDKDPELQENFVAVYQRIQAKLKEKQYDWVYDLTDKFDGNEYIFIDFCHVSPNGNAIIAKAIDEIISRVDAI
jgi:hypothetical protein